MENESDIEAGLKRIAYNFADACVSKAMARLRQHPDRSAYPYDELPFNFMRERLFEEVEEFRERYDYRELTDIGNFAAWMWHGGGPDEVIISIDCAEKRKEA